MGSCQQDSLGRLIYLLSQTLKNYVERILKPFDLTSEQFHLLKSLEVTLGRSQSELCDIAGKTPANITRILDRLAKKELITRQVNPEDRRSYLVFQTETGQRLVTEVSSVFLKLSAEIERDIDPVEETVFRRVLAQLDANMKRLSEQGGE